jgi:activator of HSP90 ATPase
MALLGEGDSRWIVQDRPDGKNVGNWHWTEKDMLPTAKNKFKDAFKNELVSGSNTDIKINFDSLKGDICMYNRKGKIKLVCDYQLKVKWEGTIKSSDENTVKGKGSIQYEIDIEGEQKFRVSFDKEIPENIIFKEILNTDGKSMVIQNSVRVINEIKDEMSNLQKQMGEIKELSKSLPVRSSYGVRVYGSQPLNTDSPLFTNVGQVVEFEFAPADQLYGCICNFHNLTNGNGGINSEVGGSFHLFDGSVNGILKEAVPNTKIVQLWRHNSWPENHYSEVMLHFEPTVNGTKVSLSQKQVPVSDVNSILSRWEENVWSTIKNLFSWNYKIVKG